MFGNVCANMWDPDDVLLCAFTETFHLQRLKNVLLDFCFYHFLGEVHQLLLSELGRGSRRGSCTLLPLKM